MLPYLNERAKTRPVSLATDLSNTWAQQIPFVLNRTFGLIIIEQRFEVNSFQARIVYAKEARDLPYKIRKMALVLC